MKRCTYCGKEYGAETSICAIDGQPVQEVVSSSPVSKSFFRWKPLSISLIALAVLYWGVALLNLWLVRMLEQQGDTRKLRFLLWGHSGTWLSVLSVWAGDASSNRAAD